MYPGILSGIDFRVLFLSVKETRFGDCPMISDEIDPAVRKAKVIIRNFILSLFVSNDLCTSEVKCLDLWRGKETFHSGSFKMRE